MDHMKHIYTYDYAYEYGVSRKTSAAKAETSGAAEFFCKLF